MRIDSVPFSLVLFIPVTNKISHQTRGNFRAFAKLLTDFSFDNMPVNIVLTDSLFNPKENVPFFKNAVEYTGSSLIRGRVEIESTQSANRFSEEILDAIFRYRMPEVYKSPDSIKISIDLVQDTVMIDIPINSQYNNLDTLRNQFLKTDELFFSFTFERKVTLLRIRDYESNALITVFGVRGL